MRYMLHIEWNTQNILIAAGGVLVLFVGYRLGRFLESLSSNRKITLREQELFTTQKGFKTLYEQELTTAKSDAAALKLQVETLSQRVDEYRKKAAGYGGLFASGGKRADAMYAPLLENEGRLKKRSIRKTKSYARSAPTA